jgi:hypothetical protein
MFDDESASMGADPDVTQAEIAHHLAVRGSIAAGSIPVTAIRGQANAAAATAMAQSLDQVEVHWDGAEEYDPAEADSTEYECADPWWPQSGHIHTLPSQYPGYRYVYQSFKWSTARLERMQACHGRVTYEAEAWYEPGPTHYLGSTKTWKSNFTRDYEDTEVFPGSNEYGKTIGTAKAHHLLPNRLYRTMIRTKPGAASTDRGKVNGQRGHRVWSTWCHLKWCVFPDRTEFLMPAWTHEVPGTDVWFH